MHATIDMEDFPGDPAAVRRKEECDKVRNVGWGTEAFEGMALRSLGLFLGGIEELFG